MPVPFPQTMLKNLGSARCLRDICHDRMQATVKYSITPWEQWFVPESVYAPGELTIALAAPSKEIMPLYATDRRIMIHRPAGFYSSQPIVHREWPWEQLAGVARSGRRGIVLSWTDGTSTEVTDRHKRGAEQFVTRVERTLEVLRSGGSPQQQWQQIAGITPRTVDLQHEALEFVQARDHGDLHHMEPEVVDVLDTGEVPLVAQCWDKGISIFGDDFTNNADQILTTSNRAWVMTDRRFLELQGERKFRIRRQWPVWEILGARFGDEHKRPDLLITTQQQIPIPDSPRNGKRRLHQTRIVEAINEAAALVRG